jgi:SH3-like domain-containing protein
MCLESVKMVLMQIVRAWLLGVFLLFNFSMPAWAQQWVSTRVDNVNMRSGPGTNFPVQWTLTKGYPLQVKERRNNWFHVKDFEGDSGWVSLSVTSRQPHIIVKSKIANLRAGPSTRHKLVTRAEYSDLFRTVKRQGRWFMVKLSNGRKAWVSSSLVWGW